MKEHIKRLFPEPGAVKSWVEGSQWGDRRTVHFYTEDQVCQIAQLIVEECATLVDAEEMQSSYGNMLKQHFGI
jgi:hypothetical protein